MTDINLELKLQNLIAEHNRLNDIEADLERQRVETREKRIEILGRIKAIDELRQEQQKDIEAMALENGSGESDHVAVVDGETES